MIKIVTALAAACFVRVALEPLTSILAQVNAQQNSVMVKLATTMMRIRASPVNAFVTYAVSGMRKALDVQMMATAIMACIVTAGAIIAATMVYVGD